MARLSSFKRIIGEDYDEDQRDMISKLAYPINSFTDEITDAFKGNINFDNLNEKIRVLELTVDSSGNPKVPLQFKNLLRTTCIGMQVIKVENLVSSKVYPSSQPFVSFEESNSIITIKNVTGLSSDNKYRITIRYTGN